MTLLRVSLALIYSIQERISNKLLMTTRKNMIKVDLYVNVLSIQQYTTNYYGQTFLDQA